MKHPAASKPDTFADLNLIVNGDVNMEINSRYDDMVIAGVDPHQDGVVCVCDFLSSGYRSRLPMIRSVKIEDVIQEWDEVAKTLSMAMTS